MIRHFRIWNVWRKHCLNGKLYKFLVLIGVAKSPSMMHTLDVVRYCVEDKEYRESEE